jgi:putative transcriptional regulator
MVFDPQPPPRLTETLTGKLLVASPALADPNFHRAVILMCAHGTGGSFGVVLNRPLPTLAVDRVRAWGRDVARPGNLFAGGPVQPNVAFAVGLASGPRDDPWWTSIAEHLGLVSLTADPSEVLPSLVQFRIFAGYAGWRAGQLETEVRGESWFVVDAQPADALTDEPEQLWHNVLRRQPGQLKMFAFVPEDISVN